MTSLRKLLLVTVSAIALCGVQACASESDLNPQPLPPEDPRDNGKGGGDTTGGGSSGATAPPGSQDAAAPDATATDAGADATTTEGGDQ